jgi:DNA repair photolyase
MAIARATESLRARLGELLAPVRDGSGLPPGWRLDDWDVEQGITLKLSAGDRALNVELEAADPTRPCFATTALFNVYYTASAPDRNRHELAPDARRALEQVVELLRAREGSLPIDELGQAPPKVQIRELQIDRALVREGEAAYYLNPYVGCMLACPFCYAMHRADFSRTLEGLPHSAWGRWVDVKINAPEIVAREVLALPPGTVRMSPIITDPYQPLERKYRISRGCLEAMAGTQFTPVVLTRSSLVLEDLELLQRCHRATVGMSVPTNDDAVRSSFEPGTEAIEARIETLAALRQAGLRTFGIIQPMLPMDPDRLVELLAPHVSAIAIGPLFEKPRVSKVFAQLGRTEMLDEPWERRTFERLQEGFAARGIPVNPQTPEWAFLR